MTHPLATPTALRVVAARCRQRALVAERSVTAALARRYDSIEDAAHGAVAAERERLLAVSLRERAAGLEGRAA